jgi:hypothetical protein
VRIRELLETLLSVQFINADFFAGQGRKRVCGEAYFMYAAAGNPRRTQASEKETIYGWTLSHLFAQGKELSKNLVVVEAL